MTMSSRFPDPLRKTNTQSAPIHSWPTQQPVLVLVLLVLLVLVPLRAMGTTRAAVTCIHSI
jgi:hypothetical protein